jgi:anti-sigma B factor antagonist
VALTVNREMQTSAQRVESDPSSDGTVVIALSGELGLHRAPEVKTELMDVIDQGARRIVLDLSTATYIDSTILSVLFSGAKRLRAVGGELAVVCTNRAILKLLEITLLGRVVSVYDDRDQALGPANAPPAT